MRAARVVFFLVLLLILLLLLLFGSWYGFRRAAFGNIADPSYGLIDSPLNGETVFLGNPVYVDAGFLLSHRNPLSLQLYEDGAKYNANEINQPQTNRVPPKCSSAEANFCGSIDARLLWIPKNVGAHVLSACLLGDETHGSSWKVCTDAVTIMVTDLKTPPEIAGTYLAQPGDTVESIAHKFGLPVLHVAADNPGIEPVVALPAGAPVNIPIDPSLLEPPSVSAASHLFINKVTMTMDVPVDKVYCYYSAGNNNWSRLPIAPRSFAYPINGLVDLTAEFRSLPIAPGSLLALDCWGWSGGSLIPLGSGKTKFEPLLKAAQLQGDHFVLATTFDTIPGDYTTLDKKQIVAAPVNLVSTSRLDVCVNHFPPVDIFFGPVACKVAVENGDIILIWDWMAPIFPPDDPEFSYISKIDGFHVYEVNSAGKPSLIATIPLSEKKTLILKKTWITLGKFMVRAYAGSLESGNSNLYSMSGSTSGLATVNLDPSNIHYGGKTKKKESSGLSLCKAGLGEGVTIVGNPSIGGDDFAVGYSHYWPEDSCLTYYEEYSRAYSSFDLRSVTGPVSSAYLSYRQGFTSATGRSCANALGVVTKDSSYDTYELLPAYGYTGAEFKINVTNAVRDWMLGAPNNGFLFVGSDESLPADCGGLGEGCIGGGTESCWTSYGNLRLTVTYFVK